MDGCFLRGAPTRSRQSLPQILRDIILTAPGMPPIILEPAPLGPPASSRRASSSSSSYAFQTTTPKSVHQKRATYYAVKTGHRTGVFETWEEAERMIKVSPMTCGLRWPG